MATVDGVSTELNVGKMAASVPVADLRISCTQGGAYLNHLTQCDLY
jgi:hypothetical protein